MNFSGFASSINGTANGPRSATSIALTAVSLTWRRLAIHRQATAEASQTTAGKYAVIKASR